jgi:hypothetical protein
MVEFACTLDACWCGVIYVVHCSWHGSNVHTGEL